MTTPWPRYGLELTAKMLLEALRREGMFKGFAADDGHPAQRETPSTRVD